MKKTIMVVGVVLLLLIGLALIMQTHWVRYSLVDLHRKIKSKDCPAGAMKTASWEKGGSLYEGQCQDHPPSCDTCVWDFECVICGDGVCEGDKFENSCNCPADCELVEMDYCQSFPGKIDCPTDRCKLEDDRKVCIPK